MPKEKKDCPFDELTPTGIKCPECKKGQLVPARGRFGPVYKCDAANKPRCKVMLGSRPTGRNCRHPRDGGRKCGQLMVEGTKTIPERCSDRECPNRNPHKLNK